MPFRVFSANNIADHERFHADFHKQWDAQRWSYFLIISWRSVAYHVRIMLVLLTTTEHGHSDLEIGDSQHTTRKLLSEAVADTDLAIIGYNIDRGHGRWQADIEQERSTRIGAVVLKGGEG